MKTTFLILGVQQQKESAVHLLLKGNYMQTTTRFGQTAGSAVGTVLMNTPGYGATVLQNKIP